MYGLPDNYNDNLITLLVRDPYCLYAYWEISDTMKASFYSKFGQELWDSSAAMLKITNVTKNSSFYIRVNDFCSDWYINVQDTNCIYVAEFGKKISDKGFISLIKSNYAIVQDYISNNDLEAIFLDYKELRKSSECFDPGNYIDKCNKGIQCTNCLYCENSDELFALSIRDLNPDIKSFKSISKGLSKYLGNSSHDIMRKNNR